MQDSVETSVKLGIFDTLEESVAAHIRSSVSTLPRELYVKLENFNPARLKSTAEAAFPVTDRPRGDADLGAVRYHRNQIRSGRVEPIWVADYDNELTLLDGAHRLVAAHLERLPGISVHIVRKTR